MAKRIPLTCPKCHRNFQGPIATDSTIKIEKSFVNCPFCGFQNVPMDGVYKYTPQEANLLDEKIINIASKTAESVLRLHLSAGKLARVHALFAKKYLGKVSDRQFEKKAASIDSHMGKVVHSIRRHKGILGLVCAAVVGLIYRSNVDISIRGNINIDVAKIIEGWKGKTGDQIMSEKGISVEQLAEAKMHDVHGDQGRREADSTSRSTHGKRKNIAHR